MYDDDQAMVGSCKTFSFSKFNIMMSLRLATRRGLLTAKVVLHQSARISVSAWSKKSYLSARQLSTIPDSQEPPKKIDEEVVPQEDDDLVEGEILLYKESQQSTILMMLGVSAINCVYWSSQLAYCFLYKGVVVQGINLAGDPMWGTVGSIATAGLLFFAKSYANHTVYQCYETQDHKRIGFQMHTMTGKPGRRFEVSIGNAKFLQSTNNITRNDQERVTNMTQAGIFNRAMRTSLVPTLVQGFKGNVLLDSEGKFYDKERLVKILNEPDLIKLNEARNSIQNNKPQHTHNRRKK